MAFKDLQIIEPILEALKTEGYSDPTPIQEQAIPVLLQGKDLLGIAQTGTGKTAAFIIPLLQQLHGVKQAPVRGQPRALILAPTRELAVQIDESINAYGRHLGLTHTAIYGGVGPRPQIEALSQGVDILTATCGRLVDLIDQGQVRLSSATFLILDEADRLLDLGFIDEVRRIVSLLPKTRQTMLFSATMPREVMHLAREILTEPVRIDASAPATPISQIAQHLLFVDREQKMDLLLHLLNKGRLERVLVFTRTKKQADKVCKKLVQHGVVAQVMHGDKSQHARSSALESFKSGKAHVLVATDVAARGIDIESISHIINYELPNEPESYVHRIGRTARAGASGVAYSFCSSEESHYLRAIERLIGAKIPILKHPFHSETASASGEGMPKTRYGGVTPRHSGEQGYGRRTGRNAPAPRKISTPLFVPGGKRVDRYSPEFQAKLAAERESKMRSPKRAFKKKRR